MKEVSKMLFKCLKRMIERGNYESKEAMAEKFNSRLPNELHWGYK